MKKSFLKTRPACKVTFRLPRAAVDGASEVAVAGDFNGWARNVTPLKRQNDGSFAATVELPTGRAYRFRYVVDGTRWENDWEADRYEPTGVGDEENSVVEL